MSITFSSGGNLGETEVSPNLKGAQKGPGNALFANFSDLLTSVSGDSVTGEDPKTIPGTSYTNNQLAHDLGEVDAKLFNRISAEGALAEPVVEGNVDLSSNSVDSRFSMDFLDAPISHLLYPNFVDESVVDSVEDLLGSPVVNDAEGLLNTPVVNDAEGLLNTPVVNGTEDLPGSLVVSSAEDLLDTAVVNGADDLPGPLLVSSTKDLLSAQVVDSSAEDLFAAPAVNSAKDLLSKSVVHDSEDLFAKPVVGDVEVSIMAPVVNDNKNLRVAPDADITKNTTLSSGNVVNHADVPLVGLSTNPSVDNVNNQLAINAPLDRNFNTTTAFMDSRIEALGPNVEPDESGVGIKFSTFEDLVRALGVFEKDAVVDESKGELPAYDISQAPNLDFLSDLTDGISIHLELKDSNSSTLFFDIRELKENLKEVFSSNPFEDNIVKTPVELLIPQTVPIERGITNVTKKDYDPFVPVKLQLIDAEGKLGVTDLFNIPGDDDVAPGVNLVSVNKVIEINPDIDTRSKLLIGLSIPKDIDPNRLPDFMKLDISLADLNRNSADTKTPLLTEAQELPSVGVAKASEVSFDLKTKTEALILALGEMSNASKNGEQIITKIASTEPLLKFSQNLNIRPVSLLEANSFFHKQLSEIKNSDFPKQNVSEISAFNQNPLTLDLLKNQIIVEKNVALFSTTKIDGRVGPINSVLNLAAANKFSNPIKSDKNYLLSDQIGANVIEKKLDVDVFNPKSFLEAADALRMKQITFPSVTSQLEKLPERQPDITGFSINKFNNIVLSSSSPSNTSEGLATGVNNKISLYSAQYASRLGMMVVDKVLKGQQNFEIHLEPESFGKIKVNVLLDKQAIDIRMVAETQAAASLLRANEDSLLQITAQNGMKLANFAVGMQSGSEQQRQNPNQNRNRVTDKANSVLKHDTAGNSQSQTSYRTSTSLNLIA